MFPDGPWKFLAFCLYFFLWVGIPSIIWAVISLVLWLIQHVRLS